jgi:hypothetical protein
VIHFGTDSQQGKSLLWRADDPVNTVLRQDPRKSFEDSAVLLN